MNMNDLIYRLVYGGMEQAWQHLPVNRDLDKLIAIIDSDDETLAAFVRDYGQEGGDLFARFSAAMRSFATVAKAFNDAYDAMSVPRGEVDRMVAGSPNDGDQMEPFIDAMLRVFNTKSEARTDDVN